MKQYISLFLTAIFLLSAFTACGDKRENSSESKNSTTKNSATSLINADDKPSSANPSEDKDKPNSLIVVAELENGEEKEITVALPSSINLDEYHIYGKATGYVEDYGDNNFEIGLTYEDNNRIVDVYAYYISPDFTLDSFAGCNILYTDSSFASDTQWDNNGKTLVRYEGNLDEDTHKTTLCSGYYEESTGSDALYTDTSIYKDPNGNEISKEEYSEELDRVMTYYVDGHNIADIFS